MELNESAEVIDLSGATVVEGPLRIGLAPPALTPTTLTPTLSPGERGQREQGEAEQKEGEKSKRREYKVTLIAAGFVRRRDGQPSDFYISAEALRQAGPLFQAAAVFVDHAPEGVWTPGYPETKHLAGVVVDPEWNGVKQGIEATLRLNSRSDMGWLAELLDELIEDQVQGEPTPDIGLSAVIFVDSEWKEFPEPPTSPLRQAQGAANATGGSQRVRWLNRIKAVESVDIVFGPGAKGRFWERLSNNNELRKERIKEIGLINQLKGGVRMDEHEVTQEESQEGAPAAFEAKLNVVEQKLNDTLAKLNLLTGALAQREEAQVVEGMGRPSTGSGRAISGRTDLERFTPAVEWLFGVKEAPLPEPEFRRADAIYRALTGDYEFRGVFDPSRVLLASATTGTLANLAVNAMNKVIVHQFSNLSFWRWYERIVWVAPNDGSLHDMQWITFGGISNLPTVAEGAAYTELTVDDVKEADPWVTKGGYVGISRKMLKNSDVQRIQAVPVALATACIRTRSAAVSAIFTDNSGVGPTLDQDSTALFHSNHSNLGTTALSQSEWRVVRTAIFKHTEVNSAKRLGYFPKFCLVPADIYDSALAIFGYGDGYPTAYTPEAQDRGLGDPRPVPLVVPDWTDTNNWAAMVDPLVFPVIQMSYSQAPGGGVHPPCELFVAMDENAGLMFSNDTLPIKVRDEFVVGVNGPRGVFKENVA